MDLVSILMNAGSGLSVFRAQAATASHNIANANTPGYARQEAVQVESLPSEESGVNAYVGRGVALQGVIQHRDAFVETQINTAFGNSAGSSAQADALSTVTALDPQATGGVADAIGNFYSSLRDLNQNPGDQGLRQAVVDSAQALATAFNRTANSINAVRSGIDQEVSTQVDKVNALSASVADLNRRIDLAVNSGRNPNDLLDVRQNDLDQLAQMIGTTAVPDGHGNVNVVLGGGTCLVSGIVANGLSVQSNTANNGHFDVVYAGSDGSPPVVLKAGGLGGQMGGVLNARDNVLGQAGTNLDTLAYDVVLAVNQQHEQGFALDGTTGHDLFASLSSSVGAASHMDVDSSMAANPSLLATAGSAGSGPGDATNLQAIIATEKAALSNGLDAQNSFAKLTSDFGIAVSTVQDSAEFDKNLLTDLTNARESVSGVSVDDELLQLTKVQNAYNALTKVLTTTNEMLDTLMKMF